MCDFEEVEHRQRRSVGLALAPLVHDGVKVNLLDAPGYVDFVGEVRAGLRAADCALFVVAANEGVDEQTRALWRECADVAMPRVVVVTKVDHARADVDGVVAQARDAFGERVLPVYLQDGRASRRPDHRGPRPRRAASRARRRHHRGVRGRDADGALRRWRGDRRRAPPHRPRARGRPGIVAPGRPGRLRQRRGSRRAARPDGVRVPLTARAPDAEGLHAGGSTGPGDRVRPVRSVGRGGDQDDHRPVPRTRQPGPSVLRDRAAGRHGARVRAPLGVGGRGRPGLQPPGPRRGRADRVPLRAAGQVPAHRPGRGRGRPVRHRTAEPGRDQ